MADPFLGEIRQVGFNWVPQGWAACSGQLLPIAQNQALFSLLGTQFGGDGRTTFGLPDLRGRVPLNQGQGSGLSNHVVGQMGGSETVTLQTTEIPSHTHTFGLGANSANADQASPVNHYPATISDGRTTTNAYSATSNGTMASGNSGSTGGNQAHNNMQPYLCVNFIIALEGLYPMRP